MNIKISVAAAGQGLRMLFPQLWLKQVFVDFEAEKLELIKVFQLKPINTTCFMQKTVDENCEAILCGEIMEGSLEILAGSCVTKISGIRRICRECRPI